MQLIRKKSRAKWTNSVNIFYNLFSIIDFRTAADNSIIEFI